MFGEWHCFGWQHISLIDALVKKRMENIGKMDTVVGCAFLTYFNPESAATAQSVLHEKQTLPGVSKHSHIYTHLYIYTYIYVYILYTNTHILDNKVVALWLWLYLCALLTTVKSCCWIIFVVDGSMYKTWRHFHYRYCCCNNSTVCLLMSLLLSSSSHYCYCYYCYYYYYWCCCCFLAMNLLLQLGRLDGCVLESLFHY